MAGHRRLAWILVLAACASRQPVEPPPVQEEKRPPAPPGDSCVMSDWLRAAAGPGAVDCGQLEQPSWKSTEAERVAFGDDVAAALSCMDRARYGRPGAMSRAFRFSMGSPGIDSTYVHGWASDGHTTWYFRSERVGGGIYLRAGVCVGPVIQSFSGISCVGTFGPLFGGKPLCRAKVAR